jgi:hypothetical protein
LPSSELRIKSVSALGADEQDWPKLFAPYRDGIGDKQPTRLSSKWDQSFSAHVKRARRFEISIVLLGALTASMAVFLPTKFASPPLGTRQVAVVGLAVCAIYIIVVFIPAFDLARKIPILRRFLSPSAVYRDRVIKSVDGDVEPPGLMFHCMVVDANIRMVGAAILFLAGIAPLALAAGRPGANGSDPLLVIITTLCAAAGIALVLPAIAVGLAFTEIFPKAAPRYLPGDDAFIAVVDVLMAGRNAVNNSEATRFVLARLEALAVTFDDKIPRSVGIRSHVSDRNVLRQFSSIAGSIRGLKADVAVPKSSDSAEWLSHIARTGMGLATGLYRASFSAAGQPISAPEPVSTLSTALALAKRIVVAVTPGAALTVAWITGVLPSDLRGPLTTFCVSWALASIAVTRPGAKDIMGLTKDLASTVQPKSVAADDD